MIRFQAARVVFQAAVARNSPENGDAENETNMAYRDLVDRGGTGDFGGGYRGRPIEIRHSLVRILGAAWAFLSLHKNSCNALALSVTKE